MKSRRKKAHEKEPNLERWLVSYADFITLLFAVFVTLYAMSMVDQRKVEEVKHSILTSFGYLDTSAPRFKIIDSAEVEPVPQVMEVPSTSESEEEASHADAEEFAKIRDEIVKHLQENDAQKEVKLTIDERGLVISLKEAGFFASGNAQIQPEALPLLDQIATSMSGYSNAFRVEGHTDNIPINTPVYPSNWELSSARATQVVHYLMNRHKYSGAKLSATGYGEYRPVDDNRTETDRRKNRRVDIVMLSQKGEQGEPLTQKEE